MKTANITTFRAELSRILDAVRHGEEYEILDRNVPVARLVPVSPVQDARGGTRRKEDQVPPWVERLRRAGKVRAGSLRPVAEIVEGFPADARTLGSAAVDTIIKERGER